MRGRRVGVQLYPGIADNRLLDFLGSAGALLPNPVLPYAYSAAADDDSVAALIDQMAAGRIDVIAFSSAPQVARLFAVAQATGQAEVLRAALRDTVTPPSARSWPSGRYFMKPLVSN